MNTDITVQSILLYIKPLWKFGAIIHLMKDEQGAQHAVAQVCQPPGSTIRAWQTADYQVVRGLSGAEGWRTLSDRPEDGLQAWEQSWPVLVATYQDQVIGFLRALTDGAITLYTAELLVSPGYRERGIGCAMLELCYFSRIPEILFLDQRKLWIFKAC